MLLHTTISNRQMLKENISLLPLFYIVHSFKKEIWRCFCFYLCVNDRIVCKPCWRVAVSAQPSLADPIMSPASSSYSAPDRGVEYCDERVCLCVSVCVCLSAIISSRTTRPIFTNFVCMLPRAVAQSSSGSVAICYVFPVLRMT